MTKLSRYFFVPWLLVSGSVFAQQDSATFVHARPVETRIGKGIKLRQYDFPGTLFGSNQVITVLEVKPGRKLILDLGYEPQVLRLTSDFGNSAKAVAALNGSFFDVKNGGSVDYLRADGRMVSENRLGPKGERALHQKAAVVVARGRISLATWDGSASWEQTLAGDDVLLSGPMLVDEKQVVLADTSAFSRLRHPRTAVVLTKKRTLLVTVDGRNEHAAGNSLPELAKICRWLGAIDAINLDGGGSTTLWLNSNAVKGVVNYPSDNNKWDHEGERKVANVILVLKK